MHISKWYPAWSDEDDVEYENKSSLKDSLKSFVSSPLGPQTFTTPIPYRLAGFVYGSDKYPDGQGIITSFVEEIRRLPPSNSSPTFEVHTVNSVYLISLDSIGTVRSW